MIIVTNGDLSANFESSQMKMDRYDMASIQVVLTGTPVGTLYLMVSNDGVVWDNVPAGDKIIAGPITHTWVTKDLPVKYAKISYVRTSGSGLLNATLRGKTRYGSVVIEQ
jgi:hypothetical protein